MRARGVKPGFFTNEVLASADPLNQVIFEGLWCLSDREGRLEDRPLRIHAQINPYRPSAGTVQALCWLHANGFIARYEIGGTKLIQVLTFQKHQNPHMREAPSKLPPYSVNGASTVLASDEHQSSPADSLFSDSLTPSSLTPDSITPPTPPERGGRVGRKEPFKRKSADELEAEARARGEDPWA